MLGARTLEAVGASAVLGKAEEVLLLKKRVQGAGQPGPVSDPETSNLLGAHGHLTGVFVGREPSPAPPRAASGS